MSQVASRSVEQNMPRPAPKTKKKLLIMGSSNTKSLASMVKSHSIDTLGMCYSSGKIENIKDRLPNIVSARESSPDYVVIHCGDINVPSSEPVPSITRKIDALIECAKTTFPQTKILLSGLAFSRDGNINSKIDMVNRYTRRRCSMSPNLVDRKSVV